MGSVVKVDILRAAIDATQAIRHARVDNVGTDLTLSEEQLQALEELSHYPLLSYVEDILLHRFLDDIQAAASHEFQRATEYLALLERGGELERRAATDYSQMYDDVDECQMCSNESTVVERRSPWIGDVAVGQCVVCGYKPIVHMANENATETVMGQAAEGSD